MCSCVGVNVFFCRGPGGVRYRCDTHCAGVRACARAREREKRRAGRSSACEGAAVGLRWLVNYEHETGFRLCIEYRGVHWTLFLLGMMQWNTQEGWRHVVNRWNHSVRILGVIFESASTAMKYAIRWRTGMGRSMKLQSCKGTCCSSTASGRACSKDSSCAYLS